MELERRLAELEQRVAALEGGTTPAEGGGTLGYRGRVTLGGEPVERHVDVTPAHALHLDDRPRLEVLAALAHPVRVDIVRCLLGAGSRPSTALQEAAGLGSTGQLYHHLKALTAAGVVEQDRRGSYRLRPEATVPVLVLLTAAADVAGQLRS